MLQTKHKRHKWRFQAYIDIKQDSNENKKSCQIKTLLRLLDATQLQIIDINANQPDAVTMRLCQPALIDMSGENTVQSHDFNVCMRTACHTVLMNRYAKQQRIFIAAWQECYQSPILTKRKFCHKFGCKVSVPTTNKMKNIHRKAAETGT